MSDLNEYIRQMKGAEMAEFLTVEDLKEMDPGLVFARGSYYKTGNVSEECKWVNWLAIRGTIHDWAIYSECSNHAFTNDSEWEHLKRLGDKVHSMQEVERLVPSTPEAREWYRH